MVQVAACDGVLSHGSLYPKQLLVFVRGEDVFICVGLLERVPRLALTLAPVPDGHLAGELLGLEQRHVNGPPFPERVGVLPWLKQCVPVVGRRPGQILEPGPILAVSLRVVLLARHVRVNAVFDVTGHSQILRTACNPHLSSPRKEPSLR